MEEKKINTNNQDLSSLAEEQLKDVSGGNYPGSNLDAVDATASKQFFNDDKAASILLNTENLVKDTLESGDKLKKVVQDKAQIWHEKAQIWHEKD